MESNWSGGLISILGMHRSGTSALAGALHKLGADLGPESSWLPPAADNPRGFFEYAPVVHLNSDVLAALGGTWSSPPALPPGWFDDERLTQHRALAEEILNELPAGMVVKDPRLSLLQPFWEAVGDVPASVHCLRHPMAVADSLLTRNGLSVEQGLFLWFRYTAAAMLNSPDALRIEYESLLEDPVPELARVSKYLDLKTSQQTVEAAAQTIFRRMAHHDGEDLSDTPIGTICRRLYDLARSGDELAGESTTSTWAHLVTELPWAGPAHRDISRVQVQVSELQSEIDRLRKESHRREDRIRRLEKELSHALQAVDLMSIVGTPDLSPLISGEPS